MLGSSPSCFNFVQISSVKSEVEPPAPQVTSMKEGAAKEGKRGRNGAYNNVGLAFLLNDLSESVASMIPRGKSVAHTGLQR